MKKWISIEEMPPNQAAAFDLAARFNCHQAGRTNIDFSWRACDGRNSGLRNNSYHFSNSTATTTFDDAQNLDCDAKLQVLYFYLRLQFDSYSRFCRHYE